ncbi:MAG: nuclear transport factor 2 family protein [Proteobacteria bacterium]|nr:nuclear transport factor 2 family protein [Pseudomonadota bacterium]
MASEKNSSADIALRYMASFETGDPDAIASNVTEDFINTQTGALGKGCQTRQTYRERLVGFLAGFKDLRYLSVHIIEQDERVAISYRMTAISDGHPIDIPGVMVIAVRDGLVASREDYWDGVTFLEQTGKR